MLSKRLKAIAGLVPKGTRVADVGTDHAYLPIYLVGEKIAASAIATDINEGPLETARKNITQKKAEKIELRLCDGLNKVSKNEVDTVIIAGMGGDNIIHIIGEAPWLKEKGKTLVLQPMSSADDLRRYLVKNGFETEKEVAVADSGKIYSVMLVKHTGKTAEPDLFESFVGKVYLEKTEEAKAYLKAVFSSLSKREKGIKNIKERKEEREEILSALEKITKILGE